MTWHQGAPLRWRQEQESVRGLDPSARFSEDALGRARARLTLRVRGTAHPIALVWPERFPDAPPSIIERGAGAKDDAALRAYRFEDRSLCLFAHGVHPRAWSPELGAADALARYVELRERLADGQLQRQGWPQALPGVPAPLIARVPRALARAMWESRGWGMLQAVYRPDRDSLDVVALQHGGAARAPEAAASATWLHQEEG